MKISFLVTYYNQKEYVKQSIDNILAIDKPCDWEILVGDDGSTDGTIDEVKKYIKEYPNNIRLYVMSRDAETKYDSVKRASANRINILDKSEGDFFCIIDGDDYYCDVDFIKEAIDIFIKFEDISIVMFGQRKIRDGIWEDECKFPEGRNKNFVTKEEYLKKYYIHSGACVYKKNFDVQRLEFISSLGYYDDNDIVVNNLNYGDIYSVHKVIYAYRQTGVSVFTSMNALEQAVLNVKGLDIDIQLLSKTFEDILIKRNAVSILTAFIWKEYLLDILGTEKYKKYINNIRSNEVISFSIFYFERLNRLERKKLYCIIKKCIFYRWRFFIKETIRYLGRKR